MAGPSAQPELFTAADSAHGDGAARADAARVVSTDAGVLFEALAASTRTWGSTPSAMTFSATW